MNCMDFLPVDTFSQFFTWTGIDKYIPYHRAVPTADLNGTIGISMGVVVLMFYFGFKVHGFGGFMHQLFCAPFGKWMMPFNFALTSLNIHKMISVRDSGATCTPASAGLMIAMLGSAAHCHWRLLPFLPWFSLAQYGQSSTSWSFSCGCFHFQYADAGLPAMREGTDFWVWFGSIRLFCFNFLTLI